MATFVRVVQAQSFSKAAATLAMPRSSVTTTIKNLEAHLGTPLLRRSTRSLSLTEAGARYFASCQTILGEIAEAEHDVAATTPVSYTHLCWRPRRPPCKPAASTWA